MIDCALLITILLQTFLANRTENSLVYDRSDNHTIVSCSSTGFGFVAWSIAAEKNLITRERAIEWINKGFDTTLSFNENNHGWLYHFTDVKGVPQYDAEISSIDTALFYNCAELAAAKLKDQRLIDKIKCAKLKIDLDIMINLSGYFSHGFYWKDGKRVNIKYEWDEYSEGVILPRLFNKPYKPVRILYDKPLFVYFYPLVFYDDQYMIDILGKAIDYQIKNTGTFGITACDDPVTGQYSIMKFNVVSPLAVLSCCPYFPAQSANMLREFGVDPLTPAVTRDKLHKSEAKIMIDQGAALILLSKKQNIKTAK